MKSLNVIHSLIIIVFILSLSPVRAHAERPDMTWGVVPKAHLTLDIFPDDTNAVAVVLFDYGESVIANDGYVDFFRHRRIKILSEDGYDWGSHDIVYRAERRIQRVYEIEAHTINIDDDGNVTRHELDKDAIFNEDVDGSLRRIRFTLPALQPGSVIEYRYKVASEGWRFLQGWRFQASEPVLWSEYQAKIPNLLRYVQVVEGSHPLHKSEQSPYDERDYIFNGTHYTWVMKDLPAIRREPFMSTVDDYRTRIRFQLSTIHLPGNPPQRILSTWPDLINELADNRNLGGMASGTRRVRRLARDLVDGITDPADKMRTIYRYVQTAIVWDGRYRVYASENLHSVLDSKTGSSVEINLLLTAMLRSVDIDADPVMLSTRSNGRIQTMYPIVGQFNHVITRVQIGRDFYLLDATDRYTPIGLLPYQSMTDMGVLIKKGLSELIVLGATMPTRRSIESTLRVEPDGSLTGNLTVEDTGFNAVSRRRQLDNNTMEEFLEEVIGDEYSLIDVDTFYVANRDEIDQPLLTHIELSSSDYISAVGEYLYINPWITGRQTENPLRLPERTFPVELVYPRHSSISVELTIPDNIEIVERSRPVNIRLPGNAGVYRKRVQVSGNTITMQREFEITKVTFEPNEYKELREFFVQVVAHDNEQLVLRKVYDETDVIGSKE